MKPNEYACFPLAVFEEVTDCGITPPLGDLLTIGLNPYTGNVVVSWQDSPMGRFFLFEALRQLSTDYPQFPLPGWADGSEVPAPVERKVSL